MNNKKGFTLIELLAVIVVLAIILTIAGTAVLQVIKNSREKTKFLAASDIVNMAEAYILSNYDAFDEGEEKCISVKKLIDEGYIEDDVTNPATGENITNSTEMENQKVCVASDSVKQTDYELKVATDKNAYYYSFDGYEYYIYQSVGDVNGDGEVTEEDVELILNYIFGLTTLTSEQESIADVTGDGVIDAADAVYIYRQIANKEEYPNEEYPVGDVNGDGEVTEEDAELVQKYDDGIITLTSEQKLRADVTCDGIVDAADVVMIQRIAAGYSNSILYGDINGDGEVTEEDVELILNYIFGLTTLTSAQESIADVNHDGKVDATDAIIICKII